MRRDRNDMHPKSRTDFWGVNFYDREKEVYHKILAEIQDSR